MPKKSTFTFTDSNIKALKKPDGNQKDYIIFDAKTEGLGIRVTKHSKIFIVRYNDPVNFCKKQESLDPYGVITIAQARDALSVRRAAVAVGKSPYEEAKAAKEQKRIEAQKARLTLGVLLNEYDLHHLQRKKASYRKEVLRQIRLHFSKHLDAPAENLKKEQIDKVVSSLRTERNSGARNLCAYGRALYNWGKTREYFSHNPFISFDTKAPAPRDHVIEEKALADIYKCAAKYPYPFGDFIRLLILTGQRRNEVAGMRWSEISKDLSTWTLPRKRAKNSKSHIVPLSEQAQIILKKIKKTRIFLDCDFVFTTNGKSQISGFSKLKKALDKACGISDWWFHDFRRTIVTWLAANGFSHIVADRILNHQEGVLSSIAAVYQKYEYLEERKAALIAWGKYIQKLSLLKS
jgi:integrase